MRDKTTVVLWRVQVESAIYSLKQVADSLRPNSRTLTKKAALMLMASRPIIPYCIHPAGNDGSCILLNRDYLPLGYTEITAITYEQYHWAHIPPPPAGLLSSNGRLYFFRAGSGPWNSLAGLERLIECLIKLLIELR